MNPLWLLLILVLLTSCAPRLELAAGQDLAEPEVRLVVKPCPVDEVPGAPANLETRETLAAIPDGPTRYTRLAADWARRAGRMEVTEPVIAFVREHCGTP